MDKVKKYLTYIILATFPIMSIINITENLKFNLALSDIFILVLGVVWLFDIRNFKLKANYPYFWYFSALILIFLISNIYNLYSGVNSSGMSGIISEGIKLVISAVYLFIGYNSCENKNELQYIFTSWLIGLWVFIVYGLYLQISSFLGNIPWAFNNFFGNGLRFLGTITDSNAAALYLSISFFVVIWFKNYIVYDKKFKIFLNITNIFIFVCIILTMSRGGIIGFCGSLCIYILSNIKSFIKNIYLFPILICLALSIFYVDTIKFKNQFVNNFILRSQDVTEEDGMLNIRLNLSLSAVDMGIDYPIVGVGRGNFSLNSKPYLLERGADFEHQISFYEGMVAHNTLAGIFAELGIIGLLIFLSIFCLMMYKLFKLNILDFRFKLLIISMWFGVFIQSMSISLENARVLWIMLGICLIVFDKNLSLKFNDENIFKDISVIYKYTCVIFSVLISLILYKSIVPKYIYDIDIDISNSELRLDYLANQSGQYIFRYYIDTQKSQRDDANTHILVKNKNTNEIIESIEYKKVKGYGNIYFDVDKVTDLEFYFLGQDNTKVKDIKIIRPDNKIDVLFGNYPLLSNKAFDKLKFQGKLVDLESLYLNDKKYIQSGILDEEDFINLGGKVRYKGINIYQLDDERVQFEFTFECLDKMQYDYIMWMHLGTDDINLIPDIQRQSGYINLDHKLEIPMSQWEIGKEYKHKYTVKIPKGNYSCSFGFWLDADNDRPVVRLYDKDNRAGISLGWFSVE